MAGMMAAAFWVPACASREIQIVTPYSRHITGPRSFEAIERQIQAQAQPFRDLYFRVQADYPHYINSYRVDLLIAPDGEVDKVNLVERDYLYKDFEEEFMHLVRNLEFAECDCPPTRIIYTFRFASQLPSTAKTEAQLEAERQEAGRREAAQKRVEDEEATLRIVPDSTKPLPPPLGPVGEGAALEPVPAPEKPKTALPPVKRDKQDPANRVKADPIPEEPVPDPNAPDLTLDKEPPPLPSGPASPEEIPPSPEIP